MTFTIEGKNNQELCVMHLKMRASECSWRRGHQWDQAGAHHQALLRPTRSTTSFVMLVPLRALRFGFRRGHWCLFSLAPLGPVGSHCAAVAIVSLYCMWYMKHESICCISSTHSQDPLRSDKRQNETSGEWEWAQLPGLIWHKRLEITATELKC